MSRNVIVESERAWYLRVRYVDPLTGRTRERKEPCGALGAPTPEIMGLVQRLADLGALEGETRRREGRPTAPAKCQRCDGAMIIHGAPAGAVAVAGAPLGVGSVGAPVAAQPLEPLPPPSAFVDAHLRWLREGHEVGTVVNVESNLRRIIREVGDRWEGGMDGVGAWLQTATRVQKDKQGKSIPMAEVTRDKLRTFVNGLITWASEAGAPWNRIPLTPIKKKRETIRQKHDRGGVHDEMTEPMTVADVRRLLALTDDTSNWMPLYMRLAVQVCAWTGLSGVDAHDLLSGDDRFEVTEIDGRLWIDGSRKKSAIAVRMPVARWLGERLRPYVSEGKIRVPKMAEVVAWNYHWAQIESALGLPHLPRQGIKRLRATFCVLIENEIEAPVAIAKALMGHRIKGRDAHGAYVKPADALLVKAIDGLEGLILG